MAKFKKFIFPGTTLLISLYISGLFALGIIFGYFWTHLFHKKLTEKGRLKPIVLKFGEWNFHLHHWTMGGLVFLLFWLAGVFPLVPMFCLGAIGGLVVHDIYLDKEWYKIISRK